MLDVSDTFLDINRIFFRFPEVFDFVQRGFFICFYNFIIGVTQLAFLVRVIARYSRIAIGTQIVLVGAVNGCYRCSPPFFLEIIMQYFLNIIRSNSLCGDENPFH